MFVNFNGFSQTDFDVFTIDGLDQRMEGIKDRIRPKFEILGDYFNSFLAARTGDEMFYHVAKHARRTVNPPKDTWVAWSNNKRGYKMAPHFQVGLWNTHLFVWFAIIYEAPSKTAFGQKFLENLDEIKDAIPADFLWCWDHTRTEAYPHGSLTEDDLEKNFRRLIDVKKSEILCGINIDRYDPILQDGQGLIHKIEQTFDTVVPLYRQL